MQSDPASSKRKDPPSPPELSTTAEPTPDVELGPLLPIVCCASMFDYVGSQNPAVSQASRQLARSPSTPPPKDGRAFFVGQSWSAEWKMLRSPTLAPEALNHVQPTHAHHLRGDACRRRLTAWQQQKP